MVHWKGALCSGMDSNTNVIENVLHWVVSLQGSCSPLFLPFCQENITGWLSHSLCGVLLHFQLVHSHDKQGGCVD